MDRSLSGYGLRARNRGSRARRGCPGAGKRRPFNSIPCRGARKGVREGLSGWTYQATGKTRHGKGHGFPHRTACPQRCASHRLCNTRDPPPSKRRLSSLRKGIALVPRLAIPFCNHAPRLRAGLHQGSGHGFPDHDTERPRAASGSSAADWKPSGCGSPWTPSRRQRRGRPGSYFRSRYIHNVSLVEPDQAHDSRAEPCGRSGPCCPTECAPTLLLHTTAAIHSPAGILGCAPRRRASGRTCAWQHSPRCEMLPCLILRPRIRPPHCQLEYSCLLRWRTDEGVLNS